MTLLRDDAGRIGVDISRCIAVVKIAHIDLTKIATPSYKFKPQGGDALSHPPLDLGSAPHRFHDAEKPLVTTERAM